MRVLYSGISFNIALCGLAVSNLAAMAAPSPIPAVSLAPAGLAMLQDSSKTTIKGTGVEFTVPNGFKGGSPSSGETKAITTAAAKMFPAMASFVKMLDDPTVLRAIAINATQKEPEVVLITRLPIPESVSIAELHDMMVKTLPSMLPPEFKLVAHKVDNVGARQIVRLTIDVNAQGVKAKESIGLFREGNQVFQVTYVYASENAQQALPIFNGIVSSFKAIYKDAPTPPG